MRLSVVDLVFGGGVEIFQTGIEGELQKRQDKLRRKESPLRIDVNTAARGCTRIG